MTFLKAFSNTSIPDSVVNGKIQNIIFSFISHRMTPKYQILYNINPRNIIIENKNNFRASHRNHCVPLLISFYVIDVFIFVWLLKIGLVILHFG